MIGSQCHEILDFCPLKKTCLYIYISLPDLRSSEKPLVSVKKKSDIFYLLVLRRYLTDSNNFKCSEKLVDGTFEYFNFRLR